MLTTIVLTFSRILMSPPPCFADMVDHSSWLRNFNVSLVGHSIGGMVARTALLLSNHPIYPNCLVRDIVLLSSPASRYRQFPLNVYL